MDAIVIAPFWDDSVDGRIFYRVSTESHLLDNVTSMISNAFDVDFRATSVFVATWDLVAQYRDISSPVNDKLPPYTLLVESIVVEYIHDRKRSIGVQGLILEWEDFV